MKKLAYRFRSQLLSVEISEDIYIYIYIYIYILGEGGYIPHLSSF